MPYPPRTLAFVLAPTDQGTLIVNRLDYRITGNTGVGVGFCLLQFGSYDVPEVQTVQQLLALRRQHFGDGVVAMDCGANIGVFTVEWAKLMTGWGSVLAVEAQERIYYALAGNIALNNCFNARAIHAAVTSAVGTLRIPVPNYMAPSTFGSLELKQRESTEFIGQEIDYSEEKLVPVTAISIDSLDLGRLDLLKIDVEGMELEALAGAERTIIRHRPIILVEHLKTGIDPLREVLSRYDYVCYPIGMNIIAIHPDDPTSTHITYEP